MEIISNIASIGSWGFFIYIGALITIEGYKKFKQEKNEENDNEGEK